MVQNKEHRPAETFADRMRQSGVLDLLEEYMDIRDELEEALNSIELLHGDIRIAMDDISGQLEDLQEHLDNVSSKLRRFKSPHAKQYEVVKDQGVLPFD